MLPYMQVPEVLPVDHTIPAAAYIDWLGGHLPNLAEPPKTTILRWLHFGLGKLGWGAVCCFVLGPAQALAHARRWDLPAWAQAPTETLPRLAFRVIPVVWAISDHFMGSYHNMYYSPDNQV